MKLIFFISTPFIFFSFGYFFGNSAPTVLRFSRERVLQEVRDDTFRKCLVRDAKMAIDGTIQEEWKCDRTKFFITKKHIRTESELGDKGAE